MKIGIIYTSIYPEQRGMSASSRRVRDIARGLSKAGGDITILCPKRLNHAQVKKMDQDYEILYIKGFKWSTVIDRFLFYRRAAQFLVKNNFGTVIYYSPTIDAIIAMIQLRRRIKQALEVSDLVSEGKAWKNTFKGFLFKLGEQYLPKYVDQSISISSKISTFNKSINPSIKDFILPVLVDSDNFQPLNGYNDIREKYKIDKDTTVIAYAGGTYTDYGLDVLLSAFGEITSQKKISLIIAGRLIENNPQYTDVKRLVDEMHLESSVIAVGWVDSEELRKILDTADVLVVPHLDLPLNNAGLPTKIAEYAMMGKAILATDLGDISKYFVHKESVYLVAGSSKDAMKQGLEALIGQKDLQQKLGKNARTVAMKHFDYKCQGIKTFEFLNVLPID